MYEDLTIINQLFKIRVLELRLGQSLTAGGAITEGLRSGLAELKSRIEELDRTLDHCAQGGCRSMGLKRSPAELQTPRRPGSGALFNGLDISRGIGLIGIVAGLAALCGWSVLPAYVIRHLWFTVSQVHPIAALGLILVGFSLRLSAFRWRDTMGAHRLQAVSDFGWTPGIAFPREHMDATEPSRREIHRSRSHAGYAGFDAAGGRPVSLSPLGCALVLLSAKRSLLCQAFSLLVTTITMAMLIADGYSLLAPKTLPAYPTMPMFTTLLLLILSLGVLNSNANRSLNGP